MAKKPTSPIVISIARPTKKQKKKAVKTLTRDVTKDRKYRKAVRHAETPIPKKVARAAARAAVVATLERAEPLPEKRTALETYTDLVGRFATARKTYRVKQKKKLKAAKKAGYDEKTGLYKLKKADKVKLAKKAKPYKAKKAKK